MWSGADASYLTAITAASREYTWHGTLTDADGTTYAFTAADIVKGSGSISRKVSSSASLDVGTVYASELTMRLYLDISRYKLYSGTIDLYCDVIVGENTYSVPMGIYTISECTQEISCISITAYDNMLKLDETSSITDQGQASPYAWLNYLCGLAGVTLGTTQAQIEAMTNGTEIIYFIECEAELATMSCRDAISYIATLLCANAYIGRDGALYLKQYSMTPTDGIGANERYSSSLSDYTTNYSAMSLTFYKDSTEEYYAEPIDTGLTYEVGANPFMQFTMENIRRRVCQAFIDTLSAVAYEPYTATIPLRPELDPMDVLTFSGNQAAYDLGAITDVEYKIGEHMTVKCSGKNPRLADAQSKESKELSNLMKKVNSSDWYSYYFENIEQLTVGSNRVNVAAIAVDTVKETKLTTIYTCNFNSADKGRAKFYVYLNSELYKTYNHTFFDGLNVMTFHFTFSIVAAQTNYIYIYMETEGYATFELNGTWDNLLEYSWSNIKDLTWEQVSTEGSYSDSAPDATIDIGYSQLTVFGKGLGAVTAWNGVITLYDDIPTESEIFFDEIMGDMTDSLSLVTQTPLGDDLTDLISFDFSNELMHLSDSSILEDDLVYYSPYINSDRVTITDLTASGGTWYGSGEIDDGTEGTLIVNDEFDTADIRSISAVDSGGYWQLSFDSGTTWVGYSDGSWSSDTIMTATQMAALDNATLVAAGASVMIKLYLEADCTTSGISVRGGSI